ncbi:hypothetical protein ACWOAQ_00465 [Helcococcus kunzii]|uniref:hypothetical protein n=1 Tax=Helcococcus kunzii TaxID=40091 RepID=UPI001C989B5B|nr:hypothetical protein [Helcococcus kunzii]MCT1795843.1 hypothetical protein [Helcococcus kunzii]MCT1989892.1 hypothetical protein [Helcococcus kunzii]QZO75793.1 hypothetical protein HIF96_05775 [Helcococcus kunzii]
MKRSFFILICLIFLVGCSKEGSSSSKDNEKSNITEASKDDTNIGIDHDLRSLDIAMEQEANSEYPFSDNIDDLLKNSDAVIYGTVLTKEKTEIETMNDMPKSVVKLKVQEVLKGNDIPNNININIFGGTVKLKEYKENFQKELHEKFGLDKFTDKELDSKYISIYPRDYTELKKNQNYIIFLYKETNRKNKRKEFYVTMSGYSIYEEKNGKFYNEQNNNIIDKKDLLNKIK